MQDYQTHGCVRVQTTSIEASFALTLTPSKKAERRQRAETPTESLPLTLSRTHTMTERMWQKAYVVAARSKGPLTQSLHVLLSFFASQGLLLLLHHTGK